MNHSKTLILSLMAALGLLVVSRVEAAELTLLSMNMKGAGANEQKPIDETVAVMKASKADIIAAQETVPEPEPCEAGYGGCIAEGMDRSRGKEIAAALGYYYHEFKHNQPHHWADILFSKYPIGKETPNGSGVEIMVGGDKIVVYSMNLNDAPYQPYQIMKIEYGDFPFVTTAAEAIKYAKLARGKAFELVAADVKAVSDARAHFVMGDFNEPSHLDWNGAAVAAKLQPMVVEFPFSKGLADLGFVDSYRSVYPNVVAKPGFTWTTTTEPSDPTDHHDRIDFIMVGGKNIKITHAAIVGEKSPEADLVVTPWPSDHRATMAKVSW
ncbi:MAG: endonuclease/exonuclease/phosphatase family protein [Candidatus Pacebacteria bacterium]|nr:endonuclease/exonuclease/phosphatase family protein [Candidatus Paceibacterota bacterium]